MTELEAASKRLCRAILAGDLEQSQAALAERAKLLAQGAPPTELALALGQEAVHLLGSFKQRLALDSVRLEQLRGYHPYTSEPGQ